MRVRWAAIAAMAVLAVLAPAARAAEVRSSWWDRANAGLLPPFASPAVEAGELLVEGISSGEEGWVAVAGVAFALDGAVSDATLTLVPTDAVPGSPPPVLCALTAGFSPAAGGPWSDVPAHDCTRSVVSEATPDGGRFVARGLAALATGSELRLLIAPGGPGRLVLRAPGAGALEVSSASSSGPDPLGGERPDGLSPIGSPVLPFDLFPPPAGAIATAGSPAPAATDAPAVDPPSSVAAAGRFAQPTDDGATRAATAAVLAVVLCAFTAMQRGGSTRLRPARVSWRSTAREGS